MSYKILGDKLYMAYLILQQTENYAKDEYADDQHLCKSLNDLKNACGDRMRAIGYKEPEVNK
jgi:hypothetical protein